MSRVDSSSAFGGRSAVPMGPSSQVQTVETDAPNGADAAPSMPAEIIGDRSGSQRRHARRASAESLARRSDDSSGHTLRVSDWLFRSREASLLWLAVRLWLGYQWANAGYQKIWGSERSAFWFGGGAGVKGFATAGIVGSTTGKGGASYGWWAGFLHNFVLPNASWIARLVSVGELLIGIGLIVGLFTGIAALAGLFLNLTYMFSGSSGVNPMYALLEVFLILAWCNAGWIGLDRLVLRNSWTPHRLGSVFGRLLNRPTSDVAPT
jgi:thiosulfate dehydrogenase [quinone] large subunit